MTTMAGIEAFIFDIDRTLLVLGQGPSPPTIAAVERCRARGLPCLVATARSQNSARNTLGPLGWLAESGVFQNGSVGVCAQSGFRAVDEMPGAVVAEAIAIYHAACRSRGLATDAGAVGATGVQASIHTADNRPAFARAVPPAQLATWGYDPSRVRPFAAAHREPSCRVLFWTDEALPLDWLADELASALSGRAAVTLFDQGTSITLTVPGTSKGSMVLRLLAHRGVDPARSAAFGDDVTDVTMLQAVGHGVAMADGHPAARSAARWQTTRAEDDGVAAMLARFDAMRL